MKSKRKNRMMTKQQSMVAGIIVVVLVLFVCVFILTLPKDSEEKNQGDLSPEMILNEGESGSGVVVTAESGTTNTGGNPLTEESVDEIHQLVETYFEAIRNGDKEQLAAILDVIDEDVEDSLAFNTEYIEAYENILCYTKEGIEDGSYVVYAYTEIKFVNIETLAPSITILYVMQDLGSGNYYIHNGIGESDIAVYIEEVTKSDDVQELFDSVNAAFAEACKKDKDLDLFYQSLTEAISDETGHSESLDGSASDGSGTADGSDGSDESGGADGSD